MKISNNELNELRDMLIERNQPLLWEVLKASIIEAHNLKNAKFNNCYLCIINLPQFRELTYEDSDM